MNELSSAIRVEWVIESLDAASELQNLDRERLHRAVQVAAEEAGFFEPAEMTLVFTDDAHVRELNRLYRGVDATTDVLAFGLMESQNHSFVGPPSDEPSYLGDVVISLAQAKRQAEEGRHSVEGELCLLIVHGTLHLLGYDHAEPEEKRHMWALQRAALCRLGYESIAPEDEE